MNYIFVDGSRVKDLTGLQFGELNVKNFVGITNKYASWLCLCSCGNTIVATSKELLGKRKRNCGCLKRPYTPPDFVNRKRGRRNLVGQTFNSLEVKELLFTQGNVQYYLCKCLLCGNMHSVSESNLATGNTKSCGCLRHKDITNMQFGELKAIRKTNEKKSGSIVWEFLCSCNTTCYFSVKEITAGRRSCGCYAEIMDEQHTHLNTALQKNKLNKNNTSGYRGVVYVTRTGKWKATIHFKRKSYHLGYFHDPKSAHEVRKIAEENLYSDFIEWYEEYKKEIKESKDTPSQ